MKSGQRHFRVYTHRLVLADKTLIQRQFIVLEEEDGTLRFTDFDKYMLPKNTIRNITDDGNNRYKFVVKFLNFCFFDCGVTKLDDITAEHVKSFINDYGKGCLPSDNGASGRTKGTVERCISSIIDFLDRLCDDRKNRCSIIKDALYKEVPYRDKNGRIKHKKMPAYEVNYTKNKREIFRDIPNAAFNLLFEHIYVNHKELLGLIALSAFVGLRPSEACNVRREDSPLGPGIIVTHFGTDITKIEIDLRHEYVLRSDLRFIGKIKKERKQTVPLIFLEPFYNTYTEYLSFIEGEKYEADYGPLSLDRNHNARSYDSYYRLFSNIIRNEIVPIFLQSDCPETVVYGKLLTEHSLSPHVFRHWYTVQLVLAGYDVAELMTARGDKNPLSAYTYIQNKGELAKQYSKVSDETFNYMLWAAKKLDAQKKAKL